MRQHRIVTAAMILAVTLATASTQAELITVTFGGTLDTVEDPNNVLDSSVFVGAPFSGALSYDPVGAVDVDNSPESGEYHFPGLPYILDIGSVRFLASGLGIVVSNWPDHDGYSFGASFFSSNGIDDLIMQLTLTDFSATALNTTDLPTSSIDLSSFPDTKRLQLTENVGGIDVQGDLDSLIVVPEPSAILLAWLGCFFVSSCRRFSIPSAYGNR